MASPKVETWKATAKSAVDGLVKEVDSVIKELADLDKKRKAVKDRLEKFAEDVNKKMVLVGFSAAERDDVGKIQAQLLRDVRKNGAAFMPYGSVSSTTLLDKTSGKTRFFIEWATP
jgi:hypothetical protein